MNERIRFLCEKTVKKEMYVYPVETEYDRTDLFLSPVKMRAKRVCEYILNQEPLILDQSLFTGLVKFDGSVEGDVFSRPGHQNFQMLLDHFYNRPINNLVTFEWQHSVGDFEYIIKNGLSGVKEDIESSKAIHQGDPEALDFLETQTDFCNTVIWYAKKCSERVSEHAKHVEKAEYRENLIKLSKSLLKVPEHPAETFYEAVLSLYFCYAYIPDSIGLIDRYLRPYYEQDLKNGTLTKEEATAYLQELFLMLQARIHPASDRFYRGGESHFCVGGYLPDGSDGFCDFSRLIMEALLDLPTWIPQISLRYTAKTDREVMRYMLDCERKDPNKRIAFVNDEPRIRGFMNTLGMSFEKAVNYTMMGCNELAVPGGMVLGFDMVNILRCMQNVFAKHEKEAVASETFEDFYRLFEKEMFRDLDEADELIGKMQDVRSRDVNIVSNIFLKGCIERAKSCLNGGLKEFFVAFCLIGLPNLIDSLSVIKQFVYDEKRISMTELAKALSANWKGYEELHTAIISKGKFFGNDDECSNEMANRLFDSLDKWNDGNNYFGKKVVFGNLIGYNEHQVFFGNGLSATPDGRYDQEPILFGIGQSNGKDREGVTALLNSVAKCDPKHVMIGPSVTNVLLQEDLIRNDKSFEKMVDLFITYFRMGGTHFQLTYVSVEDLKKAQITPDKFRSLRVRVSGFSDYFVNLNEGLQNDVIARTSHSK